MIVAATVAVPRISAACSVCVTLPEYSLADRILSAHVVVLAAPSPESPFRYTPVSLLKGTPEQLASLPEIPFLIDSATRTAFRIDPSKTVLMIYGGGFQDKAGRSVFNAWSKGFLMTTERADFLDTVRAQEKNWSIGETDDPDRVAFFSRYLTNEDRLLRNAALVEIHRAPYATARQVQHVVPTTYLLQELRTVQRLAYAPAVIRLMGLQSDPEAKVLVRSRYRSALRSGSANLTDWALAGIEVDGAEAVEVMGEVLGSRSRPAEDRQKLIQVLAEGGTTWPELQEQILKIYRRSLEIDTAMAGWIALAVKAWGTDALNASLQDVLLRSEADPATLFLIQYVLNADLAE